MLSIFQSKKVQEQESHIRNLILMANSDNSISKSEVETIFQIGIEQGISQNKIKEILRDRTEREIYIPETPHEKFEHLNDLVRVMLADGVIEEHEMKFCTDIAVKFGFRKTIAALLVLRMTKGQKDGLTSNQIEGTCEELLHIS